MNRILLLLHADGEPCDCQHFGWDAVLAVAAVLALLLVLGRRDRRKGKEGAVLSDAEQSQQWRDS